MRFAIYYNYHRLHGELDWHTPAERYDGTPFTDRGFEHVPALEHLQGAAAGRIEQRLVEVLAQPEALARP